MSGREGQATVTTAIGEVRITFTCLGDAYLAGGPLELGSTISLISGDAIYLASTGDRARDRTEDVAFAGRIPARRIELVDPLGHVPSIGGVATTVSIDAASPFRATILVNQYLSLETVRPLVPDGETLVLELNCRRHVAVGADPDAAVRASADPVSGSVRLSVPIRRRDAELKSLLADMADRLRAEPFRWVPEHIALLNAITATRDVIAEEALEHLVDHDDPFVRGRALGAIAALNAPDA